MLLATALAGCEATCSEPFGKDKVLLFVTPLTDLTDGGQIEITIPQHYSQADRVRSCDPHDYDFSGTQIKATGSGSLTVTVAEQIPSTDPSWKAGGYRLVVECRLSGSDANDAIDVSITRAGQTVYADKWVQPCKR